MFARLEYATAAAVLCIPVHNYLTDSIFFGAQAPTGINVGTFWTGLMLLVFMARYRSMPLDFRERKTLYIYVLQIGFLTVGTSRGAELGLSNWLYILSGSARVLCVAIWLRHAARVLPWTRSRWACLAFGIGPIIIGCSMFGNAAIALTVSSEQLYVMARNSGLADPNYAAVAAVLALLFLCGSDVLTWKRMELGLLLLPVAFLVPLLSGSRTGVAALIAGAFILLYGKHNKLLLSGALVLGGALFALKGIAPFLYDRFTQLETGSSAGSGMLEVRSDAFSNAWMSFLQHPLLGSGKETYRFNSIYSVGAHNTFLACLAEGGILYGVAFIYFLWYLLTITLVCNRRWPVTGRAGLAILSAYFVGSNGVGFDCVDLNSTILVGYIAFYLGGLRRSRIPAIRSNSLIHSKSLRNLAAASNPSFADYGSQNVN
jgi:O-antigen ligase